MPFPSDSDRPETARLALAAARPVWAVRPVVVMRAAVLLAMVGLSACGPRVRPQNYNSPASPPPVRDMNAASRLRVAEAAEASGNLNMAASLYAAAAAAEPGRADIQARFASVLARGGDTARAEEVLTRALERNPNDAALNVQLGRLRLRTGAAEQALAIFDRVLVRQPNSADALGGRGIALDLLDRPSEAQQAYLAARALAPNDVNIAGNLAFSFLLEGRAREARDILEPFAGRADLPSRARTSLAIARAMTGDRDAAMALLGSGVTREELDQLVSGLPNSRPGGATRARTAAAVPAAEGVVATPAAASPTAPAGDPQFRPYGEEPRPRRPARARAAAP